MTGNSERRPPRIALIAGEASGDQLGAELVAAIRRRRPDAEFAGVAGERSRAAGMSLWSDYSPLAVMGVFEVLRHLPRLLRFRRQLVARLLDWRPDVVVGIDAPDFNLGVERRMKQAGIATVHYVSPSVWAWREQRARKIAASADRVLCLFPMEPPIYAKYGVDARFVGHPLADRFPDRPDRDAARLDLSVPADVPVIAVLPGSRLGEIRRLLPDFIDTVRRLRQSTPRLRVLVPAANADCLAEIERLIAANAGRQAAHTDTGANITVLHGQAHQAMIAADAVLLASGTAALEAALLKRPMVVGYRISALTAALLRALGVMKVDRFSLPNVLHGDELVPELIQERCTPQRLAAALDELLASESPRRRQIDGFDAIQHRLRVPGGAADAAAGAVLDLLDDIGADDRPTPAP